MRLFLCEKPSQARDIARVLGAQSREDGFFSGDGIAVTWAIGHLLESARPEDYDPALKKWDIGTLPIAPEHWKVAVKKSTAKQCKTVFTLIGKAEEIVIATDADREGEMIAREMMDYREYRGPVKRLWLSALDEASIRKALANLKDGKETYPLYHSALARSRADWLVGMNLSRLFTLLGQKKGFHGVLSVGRVQTPTLKLIVDREKAIREFVPKPYFSVSAVLTTEDGKSFAAKWKSPENTQDEGGRCIDLRAAAAARRKIDGKTATVAQIETKRVKKGAPLPFELAGLQTECSSKLSLSAQETLDIAQALYEKHKATTYPRTDCQYLPSSMASDAPKVLDALAATDPSLAPLLPALRVDPKARVFNDAKVNAGAHHAIIPTTAPANVSSMSEKEFAVYDLIRRRYMAQFAPDCEYDETSAIFRCENETLEATGKKNVAEGWKAVISPRAAQGAARGGNETASQNLPQLTEGQTLAVQSAKLEQLKTEPLPRYTEGTLIKAMQQIGKLVSSEKLREILKETTGIGTNATRAGIIKGLIDKGYVKKQKNALVPQNSATALIAAVPGEVSNPALTATWEMVLSGIERGEVTLDEFTARQNEWIAGMIEKYRNADIDIKATPERKRFPSRSSLARRKNSRKNSFSRGASSNGE
jgi:DNA topoisomerase-3